MKRKKIYVLMLLSLFIQFNLFSRDSEINSILQNEEIDIGVRINEKSPNLLGIINIKESKISSYGNGTFSLLLNPEYVIKDDCLEIFFSRVFAKNFFDSTKKYNTWLFPDRVEIKITVEELKKIIQTKNKYLKVTFDDTVTFPTTCQAIVIDNLNIRDEPSLNGKKIGNLKKRDEITLFDTTKDFDEIDGEKNPWYKVKVSENEYGWVYGGYVRIFFDDENLGYSDKEKILESLN